MRRTGRSRTNQRLSANDIKKILKSTIKWPGLSDSRSLSTLLDKPINLIREVLENKEKYWNIYTKEEVMNVR